MCLYAGWMPYITRWLMYFDAGIDDIEVTICMMK